jgi:fluoroacetyl-CoA thioesterase
VKPYSGDESAEVRFVVEPGMAAAFGGVTIHPVLSTWSLVHHLEWAARRLLEPHLEPGEQGIGIGVNVRHRAPAPVGAEVVARAFAPVVVGTHLRCRVEARLGDRVVGEGEVHQAVVDARELARHLASAGSSTRDARL